MKIYEVNINDTVLKMTAHQVKVLFNPNVSKLILRVGRQSGRVTITVDPKTLILIVEYVTIDNAIREM